MSGPLQVDGAANNIKGTTNEDNKDNIALLVRDTKDFATLAADVFPSNNIPSNNINIVCVEMRKVFLYQKPLYINSVLMH